MWLSITALDARGRTALEEVIDDVTPSNTFGWILRHVTKEKFKGNQTLAHSRLPDEFCYRGGSIVGQKETLWMQTRPRSLRNK